MNRLAGGLLAAIVAAMMGVAVGACSNATAPGWTYPVVPEATPHPAPTPLMRPGLTALAAGRYTETCLRPAFMLTVPDGLHVLTESADTFLLVTDLSAPSGREFAVARATDSQLIARLATIPGLDVGSASEVTIGGRRGTTALVRATDSLASPKGFPVFMTADRHGVFTLDPNVIASVSEVAVGGEPVVVLAVAPLADAPAFMRLTQSMTESIEFMDASATDQRGCVPVHAPFPSAS